MKTLDRGLRGQSLAARLSRVALIMVAAVGVSAPAWAAGVVNHQEIVERAIRQIEASPNPPGYLALLSSRTGRGYTYYGSMFPDWGLAKKNLDPLSTGEWEKMTEIAHDTYHYHNEHWRTSTYTPPPPERPKEAILKLPIFWRTLLAHAAPRATSGNDAAFAFLFGVASHQVSDAAFHFSQYGREEAFQPEADQIHGGNPWGLPYRATSHLELELGLDTHLLHTNPPSYIRIYEREAKCSVAFIPTPMECVEWSLPPMTRDAIVEAYEVSCYPDGTSCDFFPPTLDVLMSAPGLQSSWYLAETLLWPTPMSDWVHQCLESTPGCRPRWETYPSGGMNDMVALTIQAWNFTWKLLEDYEPDTTSAKAPLNPDGNDDWYRQPVILTLEAGDTYAGVTDYGAPFRTYYQVGGSPREEYEAPLVVSEEGETTITLSSVDAFENAEPPKAVVLKIDLTPPVVTVTPSSTLTRVQLVHFSGHDPQPGSGLLSFTARLNQQPVTGQVIDPFWWGPGVYSLELTGEDLAGWVTSESHHLELQATLESLQPTVSRLCQEGHITQPGICNALSAKLDAALAARDHGNLNAMAGALNAFQNAVNAQAGKAISGEAASLLLADSVYVLAH